MKLMMPIKYSTKLGFKDLGLVRSNSPEFMTLFIVNPCKLSDYFNTNY